MLERHSILINSKWHRTTFTPALIVTQQQIETVMEKYVDIFKFVSKNWTGELAVGVKIPRSKGGTQPGA